MAQLDQHECRALLWWQRSSGLPRTLQPHAAPATPFGMQPYPPGMAYTVSAADGQDATLTCGTGRPITAIPVATWVSAAAWMGGWVAT